MGIIKKNKINSNVWKITFINVRIIFSPKDYQKWGKQYLQKNWNLNNWNLKTVLHLLPFIFGFSNMIWSRYQDQTIPFLFGQNLPGTKLLKEEMSWETFQFLKSKSINVKNLKQIDLYPNYCLFQFEATDKEKLIGIILPTQKIHLNAKIDQFSRLASSNHFLITLDNESFSKNLFSKIQDLYYNLDELPKKIESISINHEQKPNESIFITESNRILQAPIQENKKIALDTFSTQAKVSIPKKFINLQEDVRENNFINGVLSTKTNSFSEKNLGSNKTLNESINTKKIKFQKELDFLFYIQGIQTNRVKSFSNETLPTFSFTDYSSTETLQILNDFLKLQPNKIDSLRFFSGYEYPDLSRQNVYKIGLNIIITDNKHEFFFKIQLPSSFITSNKDNSLLNSTCCNFLPISYTKDNFLGGNYEKVIDSEKNKIKDLDWKNCISKQNYNRQKKTFENFDHSDPDNWFLPFKQKEKSKALYSEEYFFKDFLEKNLSRKDFYTTNSLLQYIKSNYHFSPFSESFILEKNLTPIKIGDVFKRTPTLPVSLKEKEISLKKSNFTFFESWEPISLTSWMLITQFSTGLFLLHLVKDLYKDYGRELVEYVLQFATSSGIDVEEIKEQYLYDDPGYRLIRKVKKNFKDIAGIDNLLLQLGEIVWFLRNKGRSAKLKNSIPNGILLTGPPGTGKTLLVQAIAGEAQVPIIVESGSLLTDPQQKGRGVERLKKIFEQARQLSPCIIFIDEVDTLGEKRQNIIQTPMGSDELIESIYEKASNQKNNDFIPKPLNLEEDTSGEKDLEYQLFRGDSNNDLPIGNEQIQQNAEVKKTRLSLLTQFLVEMDGLKQRQGVVVIGATNRPNVLDPALIRPGRFDQILNLELPGKQKRIEILKLYSKKLQVDTKISWDYLAKRTKGFSAADIAAAMNESTIQAIITKTTHTIETIEKGIDLVTSYNSDSIPLGIKNQSSDPFFLSRLAYYQAGKGILQKILDNHPPVVVLNLWPRQKNARHVRLYENTFSETTNRKNLEAQLISLYAGKASEILPLYGNKISSSLKRWHSDLGGEDLVSATFLANLLVDKWYFYSMQVLIRKNNPILKNRNEKELVDLEKSALSIHIENEMEDELEIEKIAKLSRLGRYQQRGFGPWWQIQVAKQTSEIESFFADWYRIYLPDPEENILNLEWIPPDEYHHSNDSLKKLSKKSTISFNDLYQIERDYVFHGLILNAFNTAFDLVDQKREFLDYFSDYLLRFEIIRENEITMILTNEETRYEQISKNFKISDSFQLDSFWGTNSRRKNSRFFKFDILTFLQKDSTYQSPFLNFDKK